MKIPSLVLRQLYTNGSLTPTDDGIAFSLKNRLTDAKLTGLQSVTVDGTEVAADRLTLSLDDGSTLKATEVSSSTPLAFPLRRVVTVHVPGIRASEGVHELRLKFGIEGMGDLKFKVKDSVQAERPDRVTVPRDRADDFSPEAIRERQAFVEDYTGETFEHLKQYSFDPHIAGGNVESFIGVAQVPIGVAGPLQVNGEHAQGEFLIPMATAEGTLVASYNRGMKVLNLSGGVKCTISDDAMQRAPVFIFEDARGARDFKAWPGRQPRRDRRPGRGHDLGGQAQEHRHLPLEPLRVQPLQLLDGRRGGAEHGRPGDLRGV